MGLPNIGPLELVIVLVVALLVLGPGKLPEVGAAFGKSIREFKKGVEDIKEPLVSTPAPPSDAGTAPRTAAVAEPPEKEHV